MKKLWISAVPYNKEEVIFNFHQIIHNNYITTKKLVDVEITDIKVESIINKSIT